ncbi:MAG: hypothetical protein IPH03_10715 [Tetrasphaera sp.]|nr:hypothetical protein [Tetrasphaera sp.]
MGQHGEQVIEFAGDSLVIDPDPREDGLVEDASVGIAGVLVKLRAVFEQVERPGQGFLLDGGRQWLLGCESSLDLVELAPDPLCSLFIRSSGMASA